MVTIVGSFLVGVLVFALIAVWFAPIAGILPALFVSVTMFFVVTMRVGKRVQNALAGLQPLLEARRVDEAMVLLDEVRRKYGKFQVMLDSQLQGQAGLIEYMQMRFDQALPLLEKGSFRNWTAHTAIGCVHYRRGRKEEAWKSFDKAASVGAKEVIVYAIWAKLLIKDGKHKDALAAVRKGQKAMPGNGLMKEIVHRVANKKGIDPKKLPESYLQFWPEEYAKQMVMRGRRGGPMVKQPTMRIGAKQLRRRS